MGTAIRTPIPPTVFTSEHDDSAVYAIFPPAIYGPEFRSCTHLLVSSFLLRDNTIVYPCDELGQPEFERITDVPVCDHAMALQVAGYELEAVSHGVA